MKNEAEKRIKYAAEQLYEKRNASGERFSLEELVADLVAELQADEDLPDFLAELVGYLSQKAVEEVDRFKVAQSESPDQLSLWPEDLEGTKAFGDGTRRRNGSITGEEAVVLHQIKEENAAAVIASLERDKKRLNALAPYYAQGMTKDLAVQAWLNDHPGESL